MLNTAATAFAVSAAAMMAAPARGEFIEVTAEGLPNEGWSVSGNGCNTFNSASCEDVVYSDINAQIGDVLLFEYGQFHDVWLHNTVEQAQECTFGSSGGSRVGTGGQGNRWDSTNNVRGFQYELTEAGDFGFSCSRSGNRPGWPTINRHCAKGQRVIVHVTDPNAAPTGETIVIGGGEGWVVKPGNAAYENIVANVGDTLQFTYSSNYHDVMLVDNENCDFSTGQLVDDTGDFAWTIPEPGTYIFACSRGSHCASGNQQITVTVPASTPGPVWSGTSVDALFGGALRPRVRASRKLQRSCSSPALCGHGHATVCPWPVL